VKDPLNAINDPVSIYRDNDEEDDEEENEPFGFEDDGLTAPMDVDGAAPEPVIEDFFVGDQAVNDDYAHDDIPHSPSAGSEQAEGREEGTGGGGPVPFDPRRAPNENNLFLAPTEDDGQLMFDYFDHTKMRNWAGPEHWKLRKVVRRRKWLCCILHPVYSSLK
jgi:condensin complex subunit 2